MAISRSSYRWTLPDMFGRWLVRLHRLALLFGLRLLAFLDELLRLLDLLQLDTLSFVDGPDLARWGLPHLYLHTGQLSVTSPDRGP